MLQSRIAELAELQLLNQLDSFIMLHELSGTKREAAKSTGHAAFVDLEM